MANKDNDDVATQEEPGETSIAVNDAWTGMLAISLFALMVGTGFLAYDYLQYSDGDPPKASKFAGSAPTPIKKADEPAKDAGAKKDG